MVIPDTGLFAVTFSCPSTGVSLVSNFSKSILDYTVGVSGAIDVTYTVSAAGTVCPASHYDFTLSTIVR